MQTLNALMYQGEASSAQTWRHHTEAHDSYGWGQSFEVLGQIPNKPAWLCKSHQGVEILSPRRQEGEGDIAVRMLWLWWWW